MGANSLTIMLYLVFPSKTLGLQAQRIPLEDYRGACVMAKDKDSSATIWELVFSTKGAAKKINLEFKQVDCSSLNENSSIK